MSFFDNIGKIATGGIAVIGIVVLGTTAYCSYKETGSVSIGGIIACVFKDVSKPFTKGIEKVGKTIWDKALKPGGKGLFNKALKPAGKSIFNKVLKPGFKQLKNLPKQLEDKSKKVVHAINPLDKNFIVKKGLKTGANKVKKGLKKIFHF